jgi:release factor glutamine methyltransferase
LLVELALTHTPPKGSLLDLGCGSGAIAIAIKRQRPDITVHALDTSSAALALAQANAAHHHCTITWQQGNWWSTDWPANTTAFDVVVSNPPYVASDDPHLQQGDCRFEPRLALDGGSDGLDALRIIIKGADRGRCRYLFLEHGYNQAASVRQLLSAQGFSAVSSWFDLAGIERVSSARWPD